MIQVAAMLALVVLQQKPLELVAEASRPVYRPGEEVKIAVKLRNPNAKPAVAAVAYSPVYPNAHITSHVFDAAGKEVLASSNQHEGQWMVGEQILPRHFVKIAPQASATVSGESFKQAWPDRRPSLKSDYEFLKPEPLKPGVYKVVYTYEFQRELVATPKDEWIMKSYLDNPRMGSRIMATRTFAPGSKALYDAAFTGKLTTTTTFEVKE